jgi:4-hydroxy-2-oxoglutarate aldolase
MLAEISNDQDDKMLLMAGAGAESTAETMKITEAMCLADADVLLVVTPSFYKNAMKPSVLVKHFRKIADFSDKPIIIYNVPANTGLGKISLMAIQNINHLLDMPAEAIADLADHPNICGVKDSGGDIAKIGHLLWLTEGKHFQVLAGSASFLHPALQLGASGGVCALANVSKYVSSYDFKFS